MSASCQSAVSSIPTSSVCLPIAPLTSFNLWPPYSMETVYFAVSLTIYLSVPLFSPPFLLHYSPVPLCQSLCVLVYPLPADRSAYMSACLTHGLNISIGCPVTDKGHRSDPCSSQCAHQSSHVLFECPSAKAQILTLLTDSPAGYNISHKPGLECMCTKSWKQWSWKNSC